jgi:transcriptional regulator with XRE-family HTH domain
MNFAERLAFERKRLGYKSSEFAMACGVAAQSQSIYENDKRLPDAGYLMKACALGADPAFLLVGTPSHPSTLQVSEEEKAPLVEFAGLSPKVRAAMMNLIKLAKDEG